LKHSPPTNQDSIAESLDRAQREPVDVLKPDRMVGEIVSVQDFDTSRAFYADSLQHRLDAPAEAATPTAQAPTVFSKSGMSLSLV
jgi:hypothetical protein